MKIALSGYGKMGKEIEKIALERGHEIVVKFNDPDDWVGKDEELKQADVAIEFSMPHSVVSNIFKCFDANVPVVVGTTGWFGQLEHVKDVCYEHNRSILYASNFSIGVNLFFEVNRVLAKLMNEHENYLVQIDETHHTAKVDSPSGTAIKLANDIIDKLDRKDVWKNEPTAKEYELEIISHRVENVPGTHSVKYASDIDEIEIIHTAKSRVGFAKGAVIAAEWLIDKKGVYTMSDLLKDVKFEGFAK
ncbi:MAG: 4-hydroxy-tetrahydrodipicolinate reductase [Flavobacteriales bacterium]|nr:4-hydroxy-tetrahydrodipicolinate reductase [Flavobacteriales bacterium]MCB9191307.1 4-hydroxy-tetrahydrodipicolinate reductase [Flavobacteriales bacterium]MCB9204313.1 4-hydroxy-tetrahydrodipicolinate reductase [Flavobacteriales bacterium]